MAFCMKCGTPLIEGSNFCHYCGRGTVTDTEAYRAPTDDTLNEYYAPVEVNNSTANNDYTCYTSTEEERQYVIDAFKKKLNGERILWKIFGVLKILYPIICIFGIVFSIFGMVFNDVPLSRADIFDDNEAFYYEYEEEYTASEADRNEGIDPYIVDDILTGILILSYFGYIFGFIFQLPAGIVSLIRGAKVGNCMEKLYTDCYVALDRCLSPSVIVFSAIFNPITLICSIQVFCFARRNRQVLLEIADIQKKYFGRR